MADIRMLHKLDISKHAPFLLGAVFIAGLSH